MRRLAILIAFVLVLSVPLSVADTPDSYSQNIHTAHYPQITIPGKNNTSFNITYFGIGVAIPSLGIKAISPFEKQNWQMVQTSNHSVSYSTNLNLADNLNLGDSINSLGEHIKSMLEDKNFNVSVYVNFSKYSGLSNSLSAYNGSVNSNNLTVNSLRNNTIEINSSVVTHFSVGIPVKLFLLQEISGFVSTSNHNLSFTQFVANLRDRNTHGMGIALGESSVLKRASGLYWWVPNYSLNQNSHPLNTTLLIKNGNPFLIFGYDLPANQTGEFDQDPFFTMVGASFGHVVFVKIISNVENYILQNSEYFAVGLAIGSGLIFVAYAGYRRKRY